jgi:hypothetical protein
MPFALLIIGVVLLVSGVRNTQGDLFTLISQDFQGKGNFTYWMVSILIIGALGYFKPLSSISRWFLALVVVVLFLSHQGFFEQFNQQVFGGSVSNAGTPTSGGIGGDLGIPIETPLAPARPTT